MADSSLFKLSASASRQLGLPDGFERWSPWPFGGMNQEADRTAIGDQEFFFRENYLRIGDGNLRTLWDEGEAIYNPVTDSGYPVGTTILNFFFFSIGNGIEVLESTVVPDNQFCIVFISDGSAVVLDLTSGNPSKIAGTGTFYGPLSVLPACSQWGTQYLLITSNVNGNAYWALDNSFNIYTAGTIGPLIDLISAGSNYNSVPTVITYGGNPTTAAVATAQVANGSVTGFTVTNPGFGYGPGDTVQFQVSGGGSDNGAILTSTITSSGVAHIQVLAGGSGYTTDPTVTITSGSGSGATATAFIGNFVVSSIAVTSGGSGYTSPPTILFLNGIHAPPKVPAVAIAIMSGEAVASVTIINPGFQYNATPTVIFIGGGGSGASAIATITGSVVEVDVATSGSAYTSTPLVTFTGGSGSGAIASALLNRGKVTGIVVVNSGSGYFSTPTISFEGGNGTGATGTVTVSGEAITSGTITSGGSGYTKNPAVIIAPGSNNAAMGQAELMPFGVSGSAIETFQSRVFLVAPYTAPLATSQGGTMNISVPESLSDFASSDGGDLFISNEPSLKQTYINIKQSNGYIYPMGDTSVDVISNVQTGGSPTVTTFNYQNVDPQTSITWRDTAQSFGLSILFANAVGAFGLYGGAVKKISKKITKIFQNAIFPPTSGAVSPTGAVASIFTIKCYLLNMTILDPTTGTPDDPSTWTPRTVMLGWDENEWFIASQSSTLTYIGTQTVASEYTAWGTDGNSLFPLFQTPSTAIQKKLSTKLYGANSFPIVKIQDGIWIMTADMSQGLTGVSVSMTVDTENGSFAPSTSTYNFDGAPIVGSNPAGDDNGFYGTTIGATFTSTSQDYVIKQIVLGYENIWGGLGSMPTAGLE